MDIMSLRIASWKGNGLTNYCTVFQIPSIQYINTHPDGTAHGEAANQIMRLQ